MKRLKIALWAILLFVTGCHGGYRPAGGYGGYVETNPYLQQQNYSIINPNGTMTTCQGMGGQLTCF